MGLAGLCAATMIANNYSVDVQVSKTNSFSRLQEPTGVLSQLAERPLSACPLLLGSRRSR